MNQKLKVAHFINSFLPVTQNWIYNQLSYNDEIESIVICQYRENQAQFGFEPVFSFYRELNPLTKLKLFFTRMRIWYPRKVLSEIIFREHPHILHGHFATEAYRLVNISIKTGIPLVTTFYGLDVNKLPRRTYWRKKYFELFKWGKLFIVEGHHMAGRLISLGCSPDKIKVVHMGIDIERIKKNDRQMSEKKSVRILSVGLEREKKGACDAVTAFAKASHECQDIEMHFIGDGRYRKPIESFIRRENLTENVFFHGFTSVDEYYRILAESDILLAPSCTTKDGDTEGGAPVVVIEAQAAGKPVVSTLHCDIPEVVLHKKTGLLCSEHDTDALASNLIKLIKSSSLREDLGGQGYLHVKKNHDITKQTRLISEIYHSMVSDITYV